MLQGYIDEAKITIVNVDTALYGRVYHNCNNACNGTWKAVKRLNPQINHLLSTYMGQSLLIK